MPQRNFMPGSEWLYYKIYSGPKTSDMVLTDVLFPLITALKEQKLITKWFFIRYGDPEHHLRVRFLLEKKESLGVVINKVSKKLQPLLAEDIIYKVQLDTYSRELERYGNNTIELSESLFYWDSEKIVQFLDLIEGDEGERLRWLFGLRSVDNLLVVFGCDLEQRLQLLERLKIGFGEEFHMARPLKKQLDGKYRKERESIATFMSFETHDEYQPILEILTAFKNRTRSIANDIYEAEKNNTLAMPLDNLMGSYIHMLMNRLFKSKNRLNEMVCYDFLYRYYKSERAKKLICDGVV